MRYPTVASRASSVRAAHRLNSVALAASLLALSVGTAHAFEWDTGNPDVTIRWDNTVRGNLGWRVENRDNKIGNTAIADEGDYIFDKGDAVAKRLDLLTELDVVYKKRYGFRVSGAGWYDGAYGSTGKSNPNIPLLSATPSYVNNNYSAYTQRFYHGGSGELLDAFVFGGFDAGTVPVQGKLGRHTLYWGESLFLGGHLHSISYSQNPLDIQKGFATPGTEAKELFRPLNQLSGQAQLTDTLSVAAQYMLEWESARYPEGGTYLGPVDFAFNGPDRVLAGGTPAAPVFALRGSAFEPKQRNGEFGLSARWSPEALDGTVGFYYRRFADKLPQVLRTAPTTYNMIYADNIDLLGVSLAKNIAGMSVGAEVSTRHNTPLNSVAVTGPAVAPPQAGATGGPRGDTWHALVNAAGVVSKTALFDQATWLAELQASHWSKLTSGNPLLFQAIGFSANCSGANADKMNGCVTKNYVGTSLAFTPTWYQVFPGVDLSAPLTYAIGLSGNAATTLGGNEGLGNYSVGLGADVLQKYRFDLKYIDFVGRYKSANGTSVTAQNGLTTFLKDRGFVSLTFKTTF